MKAVEVLSEDRWASEWRQERRLALLFEPLIREDAWGGQLIEEVLLPRWPNRLDLVNQAVDFVVDTGEWRWNELDQITIQRLAGPSAFHLCEINEARELGGGTYSAQTPVFASLRLAPITFDHLKDRLQSALLGKAETDRLLLACGFAAGNVAIPRPRPVKGHEKLPNPVTVSRDAPRIWFEIARAPDTESRRGRYKWKVSNAGWPWSDESECLS